MTEKSTLEILKAARSLITPEGAWTQRWFARTAEGCCVDSTNESASCWCMYGAIIKCAGSDYKASDKAAHFFGRILRCSFGQFNDATCRTQAEVLAKFDEAISVLEAQT